MKKLVNYFRPIDTVIAMFEPASTKPDFGGGDLARFHTATSQNVIIP
jgi:hypothetical protein